MSCRPGRRVATWLAWTLVVPSLAAAQERTEQEIVELIVRDGPKARAIRTAVEATRREQEARLVFPNPTLSYSREGAGFNEFFQVEQALPPFGARAALARTGRAAVETADAERDALLWQLRSSARASVARLIGGQERLTEADSAVRAIEQLISLLRTREQEGEGSRFDRLRAQQELAEARLRATGAAVDAADARAALITLLPEATTVMHVNGDLYHQQAIQPVEALFSRALASRAELKALERRSERLDREAEAARRALFPTPTVVGGLKRAESVSGRESGGVFGVNLSLPLFNAGGRDAARWQAERARTDAERTSAEAEIHAEVTRAAVTLALRDDLASALDMGAGAGDELVLIADTAYREGEVGILELLDAYRTAAHARFRAIEIRLDARLAQIALERAVGEVVWP